MVEDSRQDAGAQADRAQREDDAREAGLASKAESTAVVTNEQSAKSKSTDPAEQEVEHAAVKLAMEEQEEEEEEEEECAFCQFMKGGGCKDQFVAWEKCVAEAKETGDFVSKCADITESLQLCMNSAENKDYYQLFLEDQDEYVQEHKDKESQLDEEKESEAPADSAKQPEA